jgi:hypothetical protein
MYFVWEESLHRADGGKRTAAGLLELLHSCFHHLRIMDRLQSPDIFLDFPAGNLFTDQYLKPVDT